MPNRKRKRKPNSVTPRLNKISPGRVGDTIHVTTSTRIENLYEVQGLTFQLASAKLSPQGHAIATYKRVT